MKKYIMFMLLLLSFTFMLSACAQSEEEKIQDYLETKALTFYHFLVVDFTDGKLNIEVQMYDPPDTWSNDEAQTDVVVESKELLEAVQHYSKEHLGVVKEANLSFITIKSRKTVAEINANNDTILETNWRKVSSQEFSQLVDGYKFYGTD